MRMRTEEEEGAEEEEERKFGGLENVINLFAFSRMTETVIVGYFVPCVNRLKHVILINPSPRQLFPVFGARSILLYHSHTHVTYTD